MGGMHITTGPSPGRRGESVSPAFPLNWFNLLFEHERTDGCFIYQGEKVCFQVVMGTKIHLDLFFCNHGWSGSHSCAERREPVIRRVFRDPMPVWILVYVPDHIQKTGSGMNFLSLEFEFKDPSLFRIVYVITF